MIPIYRLSPKSTISWLKNPRMEYDRPFPLACRLKDSSGFSISILLGFLMRPLADDFFPCLNLSIWLGFALSQAFFLVGFCLRGRFTASA